MPTASRPLRHLCGLAAATALASASAAEPAPSVVEFAQPDLIRSHERFAGSIYGSLWNDPLLAELRARIDRLATGIEAAIGSDPRDLILGARSTAVAFSLPHGLREDPAFALQLDGAPAVAVLVDLLGEQLPLGERDQVVDAVSWWHEAERCVIAGNGAALTPLPAAASAPDADLVLRWDRDVLVELAAAEFATAQPALAGLIVDFLPAGHLTATVHADGASHTLSLADAPAGLVAVDRALLARLPADALAVVAVGLDGAEWWAAHQDALMPLIAASVPGAQGDPARATQLLTAYGQMFGIPGGAEGLAASLSGTAVVVVGDGGLVPSLTIGIPRQAHLDSLLTTGAMMAQLPLPAEGEARFLVLRGRGPGGNDLAPGVVIGRDAGHWWIGTDPLLIEDLLAGEGGGWPESRAGQAALAAAGEDAEIVGGFTSRRLLGDLVPLAALGGSFVDRGRHADALGQLALRFARDLQPDVLVAGPASTGGWQARLDGPITGLPVALLSQVPVHALILSQNLQGARGRAQAGEQPAGGL